MLESSNNPAGKVASDTMVVEDSKVDMNPDTNRLALAQMMGSEEFRLAEKKLKRKLDIRLLGVMWLIFVLNYLDRVCLASNISPKESTSTDSRDRTILQQQRSLAFPRRYT